MIALLISSIIFGAVHISAFFFQGGELNPSSLAQAFLKTIQTGMFGFLLGAIFIKYRSIWGIAFIHAVGNFLFLSGSVFIIE